MRGTKLRLVLALGTAALVACGLNIVGTDNAATTTADGGTADDNAAPATDASPSTVVDGAEADAPVSTTPPPVDAGPPPPPKCNAQNCSGTCTSADVCTIDCGGGQCTTGPSVKCPPNATCTINCNDEDACDTIDCGMAATCNINCTASKACKAIGCGMASTCNVRCEAASETCSGVVDCGMHANCTIKCEGASSCTDLFCNKPPVNKSRSCDFDCTLTSTTHCATRSTCCSGNACSETNIDDQGSSSAPCTGP